MTSPFESEIESNFEILKAHLDKMKAFVSDAESEVEMFKDIIEGLENSEAISTAQRKIKDNPGFSSATAIDEAHKIDALFRENLMRNLSKRDYYEGAESYLNRELEYLTDSKVKSINYINGKMPIQGNN